jgi:hypothetical protein
MQVLHMVTKRVEPKTMRVWFRIYNDSDTDIQGDILIEMQRWVSVFSVYNCKIKLQKIIEPCCTAYVSVDISVVIFKRFEKYTWAWVDGDRKFIGKGRKSDKIEYLA